MLVIRKAFSFEISFPSQQSCSHACVYLFTFLLVWLNCHFLKHIFRVGRVSIALCLSVPHVTVLVTSF